MNDAFGRLTGLENVIYGKSLTEGDPGDKGVAPRAGGYCMAG